MHWLIYIFTLTFDSKVILTIIVQNGKQLRQVQEEFVLHAVKQFLAGPTVTQLEVFFISDYL